MSKFHRAIEQFNANIAKINLKRMLMQYVENYKYESHPQHLVVLTCEPPVKRNSSTVANKYAIFVPSPYNQWDFSDYSLKIINPTKLSRLGLAIISNCEEKALTTLC